MEVDEVGNFHYEIQDHPYPIAILTINNIPIKCLIDTGAAFTVGDQETFKQFESTNEMTKPMLLKTITGSFYMTKEALVPMPKEFEFDDFLVVKLVDLSDKPFHCIIGNDVLSFFGAIVDYHKGELRIGNKIINIRHKYKCPFNFDEINTLEPGKIDINSLIQDELNEKEKNELRNFLNKNKPIFYQEGQQLTTTNCVKHQIVTTSDRPVYAKTYRYPQIYEKEIEKQIKEMLEQGIIRHSKSPYNSPLWIVPKKTENSKEKKYRLVIDYRKLNEITIDDKYPIPNIESIYDKLGRAIYFTTLDLAKGFHQIPMEEKDKAKTAFSTPMGHFEFNRMPFGLKNSPATFQRMMNFILGEFVNRICVIYMDDILVFSSSIEEHFENLGRIFERLHEFNLKIQLEKCKFLRKETEFLGHVITEQGIKPNPKKIEQITKVKIPRTVTEIKSFLGLSGYYRKFIKNYSMIASPMIKYLKKNTKININDSEYVEAFNKLKRIITSPPILAFPDFNKKFTLTTDASNYAVGAVLSQCNKPLCYASRTLNGHEKNYSTLEKELLAIVWAIKYFRPYLYGRKFLIQTDHQPLKWLNSLKEPNSRIIRWKILLGEYDFNVEYLKGKDNRVADFLSRVNQTERDNQNENVDYDVASLFVLEEEYAETIHSGQEELHDHFFIIESIVNKYKQQIRIVKNKNQEQEILYRKYKIIYVEENDLENHHYLNDLFRRTLKKGTIGIYSELNYEQYNKIQQKLIELFANERNLKFIKCTKLVVDIKTIDELFEIIEEIHIQNNHRGVNENFEEMKSICFYPGMKKYINKYINNCKICNENKYERKPFNKFLNHTETPNNPNMIVHFDIFQFHKTFFLTSIDRFTKMATVHKLTDKNMITVKSKIEERIAFLGKPAVMIMDNEFNNALIKLFCSENNIKAHFTTPNSHTGNSDIERFHSSLIEHIRIIKRHNEEMNTEELAIRAVGYYNNSIHSTTNTKPMDFINKRDINFEKITENIRTNKSKAINRINKNREPVPTYNVEHTYVRNPKAIRHKTERRFIKYIPNERKVDITNIKRPLKFTGHPYNHHNVNHLDSTNSWNARRSEY